MKEIENYQEQFELIYKEIRETAKKHLSSDSADPLVLILALFTLSYQFKFSASTIIDLEKLENIENTSIELAKTLNKISNSNKNDPGTMFN